jgi:1-acyl-sn-glycerol-3-phosphate acyltransferase
MASLPPHPQVVRRDRRDRGLRAVSTLRVEQCKFSRHMLSMRSVANAGHAVGWTVFMCSVAVPLYSVTRDRPQFQKLQRIWAEGLAKGWGLEVQAFGVEQLDPDGTYVFMANHLSHVDIVALFVGLPMNVGFLAKRELRRIPFLAQAMVAGGHVFIDRKERASAMSAMSEAAREVAEGASLVIFPEGTRGFAETVQPFKRGGFHLARQARVPVVPVGLRGTRTVLGREDYLIRPGRVEVHVGAPLHASDFENVGLFADATRARVSELASMPFTPSNGHG